MIWPNFVVKESNSQTTYQKCKKKKLYVNSRTNEKYQIIIISIATERKKIPIKKKLIFLIVMLLKIWIDV